MRRFKLKNADGEEWDLNDVNAFLWNPGGLGYARKILTVPAGYDYIEISDEPEQKMPYGDMVFSSYAKYSEFVSFCEKAPLVLGYMPISTWGYLDCKVVSLAKTEIDGDTGKLICPVSFIALSAWYKEPVSHTAQGSDAEGKVYPYTYPYTYRDTAAGSVEITNNGIDQSPCKIHIFGPVTNPSWSLIVGGETILDGQVNVTIADGNKLVIDSSPKSMEIAEYTNVNVFVQDCYQDSDFDTDRFILLPKGNSLLSFSHEGLGDLVPPVVEVKQLANTFFKVEVFDRDIVFKSHTVINDTPFADDYLTLRKTIIDIPKIDVVKGDYVHITDFSSNIKYQGIVDDVETDKYTCTLTLKPMRSLFDALVSFDRTYLAAGTIEGFIAGTITAEFISNADTLQNITGLSVSTTSSTYGAVLDLDSNIGELYNIIIAALSSYSIVVDVELKPQDKEIDVTIGAASATVITVEADLDNCIDKNFVIGDSYGAVNKLILYNQDNEAETATYYLHTDGTISATDTDRITSVVCRKEYLPSRVFAEKALARATQILAPQKYDNLIELTYNTEDKIVRIANMPIGTAVIVKSEGNVYNSILTGCDKSEDVAKLVFGIVRIDQASRQFMQKRSGSGAVYATAVQGEKIDAVDAYIVESGSNTNGYYEKYSSGKMKCWHSIPFSSLAVTTAIGNGYQSAATTWTFPEAFDEAPKINMNPPSNRSLYPIIGSKNESQVIFAAGATYSTTADGSYDLTAIGNWS